MHIKSIVLDGFKSYANRVEVKDFDQYFNAITGLNGTGKSNILDSICFVLGISNLKHVRAGNLQDLIYKSGNAGITKATVSVTFDNRSPVNRPFGIDTDEITVTRQIALGGKNRYYLNGVLVQNKRIMDMFCGIQLNVNNPHFIIMQGCITKMLNMKPEEIMSLVEEAAGTKMYETKKVQAEKTIIRKDIKLRELNSIIAEDISPRITKLIQERTQFQEHQQVVREIENLTRVHVAWRYIQAEENAEKAEKKVQEAKEHMDKQTDMVTQHTDEAKEIEKQIEVIHKELDKESGDVLSKLSEELGESEAKEAVTRSSAHAAAEAAEQAEREADRLKAGCQAGSVRDRRLRLDQAESELAAVRARAETAQGEAEAAQLHLAAVCAGQQEESVHRLRDELAEVKREAYNAATRMQQDAAERDKGTEMLQRLQAELHAHGDRLQGDRAALERAQAKVDGLKEELARMAAEGPLGPELRQSVRSLACSLMDTRDRIDRNSQSLSGFRFHYSDPEPNFNRRRVFGPVYELITVPDTRHCLALESAAGSRLSNVVVDSYHTGKLVMEKGRLRARTTMLPLDKINYTRIEPHVIQKAEQLAGGPDRVWLALDLVRSTSPSVNPAMYYVFGNTLVCRDMDISKQLSYHPQIRKRSVTLEGDVFEPSGLISGGHTSTKGGVLECMSTLSKLKTKLKEDERQLQILKERCNREDSLKASYDAAVRELEALRSRQASSSAAQLAAERDQLRDRLGRLEEGLRAAAAEQERAAARAGQLEAAVAGAGAGDRQYERAERDVKEKAQVYTRVSEELRKLQEKFDKMKFEVEELERASGAADLQLAELAEKARGHRGKQTSLLKEADREKSHAEELRDRIAHHKNSMAAMNTDIVRLTQRREALLKRKAEAELRHKELALKLRDLQKEEAEHKQQVTSLERGHPWIPGERRHFGVPGGAFSSQAGAAAGSKLGLLATKRERLARGLNQRAQMLLGVEEDQYKELLKKKMIVEKDRAKLEAVIVELDKKKQSTLRQAVEKVAASFGNIFSSLLPGARSELNSTEGGLQVRVGFGGSAWKESLSELSGGQRSLVALALILALLEFRPAPLYILDEVDAALDLQHTQNIGTMLRKHFRNSQFIIVSLKDGMFNNANVLYRTRFEEGMSSVQRTVSNRRNN